MNTGISLRQFLYMHIDEILRHTRFYLKHYLQFRVFFQKSFQQKFLWSVLTYLHGLPLRHSFSQTPAALKLSKFNVF